MPVVNERQTYAYTWYGGQISYQTTSGNQVCFFKTMQQAVNYAAVEGATVWRVLRILLPFGWVLERTTLIETIAPSRWRNVSHPISRR